MNVPSWLLRKQQAGSGVAGHINIRPAIVVEIRGDHGHAVAAFARRYAGLPRDIRECAVAIVAIEGLRARRQAARTAIHGNTFPLAVRVLPGFGNGREVEIDIIGDKQIEMAVAIVVDQRAAGAPARPSIQQVRPALVTSVNVPSPLLR